MITSKPVLLIPLILLFEHESHTVRVACGMSPVEGKWTYTDPNVRYDNCPSRYGWTPPKGDTPVLTIVSVSRDDAAQWNSLSGFDQDAIPISQAPKTTTSQLTSAPASVITGIVVGLFILLVLIIVLKVSYCIRRLLWVQQNAGGAMDSYKVPYPAPQQPAPASYASNECDSPVNQPPDPRLYDEQTTSKKLNISFSPLTPQTSPYLTPEIPSMEIHSEAIRLPCRSSAGHPGSQISYKEWDLRKFPVE